MLTGRRQSLDERGDLAGARSDSHQYQ